MQWGFLAVLVVLGAAGFVAGWAWPAATLLGLGYSLSMVGADLIARRLGTDLLATLSLVGTLLIGEFLAGMLIALMLGTGQVLEGYARRRAHRDLDALLARAPRFAQVRRDGVQRELPLDEVIPGDIVLVRSGELVPVDGRLFESGTFDESALTGESLPVDRPEGAAVRSGIRNAGAAVTMHATRAARDSAYANVVRLAERALADAAPVARIADRFAVGFVPLALAVAGVAWWWSGQAVRAVAVLVTATPCPLLLAVPVAIAAGMSATSRRGVVVKDGGVLERLGRVRTAILDKTGTVTAGVPAVVEVIGEPGRDPLPALAWAAAVEHSSPHVLASAVVAAARQAGAPSTMAYRVTEVPGVGAHGMVDGQRVSVGRLELPLELLPGWVAAANERARVAAAGVVWVNVGGRPALALLVRDEVRPEAARTLSRLRAAGVCRLILVTGDRREVAEDVGRLLGVDDVVADATPESKVERVLLERRVAPTVAVGDGINDAPALAAADVGVAIATRGPTATSEVADAVLTGDRLDRLADAVEIARHARAVAVQSALLGVGLSLVAMAAAAVGLLAPAGGALLQEVIDVLAVGNALRALRNPGRQASTEPGPRRPPSPTRPDRLALRPADDHAVDHVSVVRAVRGAAPGAGHVLAPGRVGQSGQAEPS